MNKYLIIVLITLNSNFISINAGFYADKQIQENYPSSFALGEKASGFIKAVYSSSFKEADHFIDILKNDTNLWYSLEKWEELTLLEQIPLLRIIFDHEVRALNITAPKLIIDLNYEKAAYFEFTEDLVGPGTVYLNPSLVFNQNKYSSLSLLIHETRHSAQLQKSNPNYGMSYLGYFYRQSFLTQKEIGSDLGFCDFLTLNNEYEAFLFGNYIINKITQGKVDIKGMGTFASQFHANGEIKIDLNKLQQDSHGNVLESFNELEKEQAKRLGLKN